MMRGLLILLMLVITGWGQAQDAPPPDHLIAFIASCPDGSRLFLMSPDGVYQRQVSDKAAVSVRWMADGERLHVTAYENERFQEYLVDIETIGLTRIEPPEAAYASSKWSPYGRQTAYLEIGDFEEHLLFVANADGSYPRRMGRLGLDFEWSPDGMRIGYFDPENLLQIADTTTGQPLVTYNVPFFLPDWMRWSPDGRYLMVFDVGEYDPTLYLVSADGKMVVRQFTDPEWDDIPSTFVWSPDSRRFAYSTYTQHADAVYIIDIGFPNPPASFSTFSAKVFFSDLVTTITFPDEPLTSLQGEINLVNWTEDGRYLLLTNDSDSRKMRLALLDVETGEVIYLTDESVYVSRPALRPRAGYPVKAGEMAEVVVFDDGLNLRADPSTSADVLGKLPRGAQVEIIGDLREADEYTWIKVHAADGTAGWVVTRSDGFRTLIPVSIPPITLPEAPVPVRCE